MAKPNLLRRKAAELGEKLYMPDLPCKKGHAAFRRVDNGSCVACLKENNKQFTSVNKDQINARRRKHRAENPELYANKKLSDGFIKNVQKQSKVRVANGSGAFIRMTSRMKELNRIIKWDAELTELVCKEAHHLARLRDKATGIKWSVDHIVPIKGKTVSGLHTWKNLQVIPMQQNRLKHNFLGA